jgi:two-component system chemotaxis response regulator CheB
MTEERSAQPHSRRCDAVAIGSSTGGPNALLEVFQGLARAGGLRQPVFVCQHMPDDFLDALAENIASVAGTPCLLAAQGMEIRDGHIYLAPGGHHMGVRMDGIKKVIALDKGPPVNFCRPSVDVMLQNLIRAFDGRVLSVLLTGMGTDGLAGCRAVTQAGGTVLAQDEESSVVWGMPGAVAQAGLCAAVVPLPQMAAAIRRYALREDAA